MLQPLHIRLTAQQGTHAPERLSLSLSTEGDGAEINLKKLISDCADTTYLATRDMQSPVPTHKLTPAPLTPMIII